jgi:hypothetical protein
MRKMIITAILLSCVLAFAQWDKEYLRRNPPPPWSSVTQMHAVYVEKFIQSSGFGIGRMTQDLRNFSELVLNGQPYVVEKVELIGLVKHPEPTAYVISSTRLTVPPDRKSNDTRDVVWTPPQKALFTNNMPGLITTRALTAFETNALVELREGRNEVVGMENGAPAILGAVRARRECLKCHDGESGTLLGAFSYLMALSGKPAPPVLTNNPASTNLPRLFSAR